MNIVQLGGCNTNTIITSREKILEASRSLIREKGWSAVNIRAVAAACGVSIGSIYNYFPSKSALVSAAVESIWEEIFHHPDDPTVFQNAESCILWMFRQMEKGSRAYPGCFSLHSLSFMGESRETARQKMEQTWTHMRSRICAVLKSDDRVRPNAFDQSFTPEMLANLLFSLMLSAFLQENYDPSPVLEMIRRTIY